MKSEQCHLIGKKLQLVPQSSTNLSGRDRAIDASGVSDDSEGYQGNPRISVGAAVVTSVCGLEAFWFEWF